jgi:hypothetical protein
MEGAGKQTRPFCISLIFDNKRDWYTSSLIR